jgi:hypothetical protein
MVTATVLVIIFSPLFLVLVERVFKIRKKNAIAEVNHAASPGDQ